MISILSAILSLFYPRRCPVCDEPVRPWNALICRECESSLAYIKPPRCMKCGKHIGESGKEYCADCAARVHLYDRGRALFSYRTVSASIVLNIRAEGNMRLCMPPAWRMLWETLSGNVRRTLLYRCLFTKAENGNEDIIRPRFLQGSFPSLREYLFMVI